MSLLSGWMGHASNVDIAKLQKEYAPILADGEQLVAALCGIRLSLPAIVLLSWIFRG
jgi:hypothetical protein